MRALVLKRDKAWQAERPDRDAPESPVLREEDFANTRLAGGVHTLFDELEKRQAKTMSVPVEPQADTPPIPPSQIRQCITCLLEIEVELCRLLHKLTQLEEEAR